MSEFFSDKDYGDYFSAIESHIKNGGSRSERPSNSKATAPAENKKKRTHGRSKRGLIPISVLMIAAIIVSAVTITAARSLKPQKLNSAKNKIASESAADTVKGVPSDRFAEFTDDTADIGSDFKSGSIIVINNSTKKVVAARDAKRRAYPASTTKIMTLLIAAENIKDFNKTFTMSYDITDPLYIAEATVAGFSAGESVNMTDLLYGTILPSGADASIALAITVAGSEEGFVALMNKKAEELGLRDTHFTNCTGLYDQNHYTTAEDLSVILAAAMENNLCRAILSTYQYTTAKTAQHPEGILLSSTLFSYMYGTEPEGAVILGGKTGFVNESGYCIASFGRADSGNEYICVTLNGEGRWPTFYDQIDLYSAYAK